MAQIASAYPTAGGLYHWSSILGNRFTGWLTAWLNLLGLVTVLGAINVGTWGFFSGAIAPWFPAINVDTTVSEGFRNQILFVAGIRLRYFGYAFAAALLPLYFLIFHVAYRRDRILAFWNPYADPKGFGFHIIQSLIAVSTGGVTGLGLMEGKQKLFYLPEPHTDFIFAVTAEELGLVGALAVVILFAIFLWRGTRAALRAQTPGPGTRTA